MIQGQGLVGYIQDDVLLAGNKKLMEQYHIDLSLSKDLFKEHSLFLLKEHCKLFSPYSNKARELLDKLIQL